MSSRSSRLVPRPEDCLAGGGAMGALMRATDWSSTALGPVAQWPQSLRTAVSIMLESKFAMVVAWGADYRFFYNDRYQPILGVKHPAALGTPGAEIFPEVWGVVGPEFDRVWRGEAFAIDDWLLPLERQGYLESCWFTLSYSPIRDESGGVGGVLAVVTETTARVEGERRLATLRELAQRASEAKASDDACRTAAEAFEQNPIDVPFALFYLVDDDGTTARRVASVRLEPDHPAAATPISLAGEHADRIWPLGAVLTSGEMRVVDDLASRFGELPGGEWPEPTTAAVLHPLARPGVERPFGVLVAGISPRRRLDDAYRGFFELAAEHLTTAVSNAHAFEAARRRAEALAEIDRAKTAFFSNLSHEFRTPLTLILGPLADALSLPEPVLGREPLEALQRNARRLLRLVNALLDFSRIEARRMEASFEPTDLPTFTSELASGFRSAVERAGLVLEVDCAPTPEPAHVDRQMWETIVLNLLSNAFKFTFEGRITVRLRAAGETFRLEVLDTGVGIPAPELPRLFERFHRVEGARARTEEGSGIGLALVQELVRMHDGEIEVESELGRGSCFRVTIPKGAGRPQPRRAAPRDTAPTGAAPYVEEASRWLQDDLAPAPPTGSVGPERVLVADDNADMRDYLRRILGNHWRVEVVPDGAAALSSARANPPDLVLTDVMMPGLDGFALLRALREDETTRHVPVVMLSARAGEESRVEGLDAGADDYLVKPFSARELVARVGSQLALARERAAVAAHRAEADLQRRNFASLLMQAPTPICIIRGPRQVIELANPPCCRFWQRSAEEVVGRPLMEALPELAGQGFDELLAQVVASGEPYVGKEHPAQLGPRAESRTHYFNFVYEPLRDVDGRIDGVMVIAFDVTDEVAARQQMERLRATAEAANRAKDEFLAMFSHELRNPLSPILTAVELLRRKGAAGFERELGILERQSRHLARLIDDLLDVSRLTRGKVALSLAPVEVAEVVGHAIEMVEPLLEERRHRLSRTVPSTGLRIDGDAQRLAQVVANLLSNAARYTPPGGHLEIAARAADGQVEIVVRDDGAGIDRELLPRLFEPFVQGPRRPERAEGGLGLGLAIVKSLVTLHGGTVTASSPGPGQGSELVVRLPLIAEAVPDARPVARPATAAGTLRRILVVDDNPDAADLLAHALTLAGYTVAVAHDGPSALAVAARLRPQVALLDIGLPVQDGYELAVELTAAASGEPPKLVAVTGYGTADDRRRSREAGFSAHLTKPVDLVELETLLAGLADR